MPGKKPPAPSVKRRLGRTPPEQRSGSKLLDPSVQRQPTTEAETGAQTGPPVRRGRAPPAVPQAQELVHRRLQARGSPPKPVPLKLADVRFEALRAGGPGGQHQNKTERAVRGVHGPTGVVVAREARSQHRNKVIALERLTRLVKLAGELAEIADRDKVQTGHALLERGRPVRTFKGER